MEVIDSKPGLDTIPASVEHTVQFWWLASQRLHDCAGDEFTMRAVEESLCALRLNEWSTKVAQLADCALQQMHARKRASGTIENFILSKNLYRRHLTTSQRAMTAGRLANMKSGSRTDLGPNANLREVSRREPTPTGWKPRG